MILLYLYENLLSDACQNIWNGNEPIGVIGEKRPNQWSVPEGNWAVMHFDNWKIHHTYEKNWIRNALILMDGWQFSDNQRGWIIKSGFNGQSSAR